MNKTPAELCTVGTYAGSEAVRQELSCHESTSINGCVLREGQSRRQIDS